MGWRMDRDGRGMEWLSVVPEEKEAEAVSVHLFHSTVQKELWAVARPVTVNVDRGFVITRIENLVCGPQTRVIVEKMPRFNGKKMAAVAERLEAAFDQVPVKTLDTISTAIRSVISG